MHILALNVTYIVMGPLGQLIALPKRPGWIVGWTSQSVGEGRAGKEGGEHEENGRYVQDGRWGQTVRGEERGRHKRMGESKITGEMGKKAEGTGSIDRNWKSFYFSTSLQECTATMRSTDHQPISTHELWTGAGAAEDRWPETHLLVCPSILYS